MIIYNGLVKRIEPTDFEDKSIKFPDEARRICDDVQISFEVQLLFETVEYIDFNNIEGIDRKIVLNKVKKIDAPQLYIVWEDQFSYCEKLMEINIPRVETIKRRGFFNCRALESIKLSNIARIDEEAFYRCVALTKAELGDNIKFVGTNAFRNTNVSYIDLKQAEEVRTGAFKNCTHLFQIRVANLNVLKSKANVLEGCEDLRCITLTQGSVSAKKYPYTKIGCEYSIESIKDNERIRLLSGNSAAEVYHISQKISGESFDDEEFMSDIYVTDGGDMVAVKKSRTTGFKYVCRGDTAKIRQFLEV